MKLNRFFAPPNKKTFLIKPIKKLLQKEIIKGIWLDPFANDNTIKKIINNNIKIITNDLNSEFKTDYNLDAINFLRKFENNSIDGVIYDPPYSVRQVSECYKNVGIKVTSEMTRSDFWSKSKKEIVRILKTNGKVILFGWNSNGIAKKYGFIKEKIILIAHGGQHHDTIIIIQIKKQRHIDEYDAH